MEDGKIKAQFSLAIPEAIQTRSLEANENILNQLDILVFHDSIYRSRVQVDQFTITTAGYTFEAHLDYYEGEVELFIFGNSRTYINANIPPAGTPLSTIRSMMNGSFVDYQTGQGYFPMFAEKNLESLTEDIYIENLKLVRAFARIEVLLSEESSQNFTLESIQAFRANDLFALIPDNFNPENGKVSSPTVPQEATRSISTDAVSNSGADYLTGLYLPESGETDKNSATCIVIGGSFNNNPVSYYKVDLEKEDHTNGVIIRNHSYLITVTSVSAQGYSTPEQAAQNESIGINTDIIEWEDDDSTIIYDGNGSFFRLSTKIAQLFFYKNSTRKIIVASSMPYKYYMQWADEAGRPVSDEKITYGETFENSSFKVSISPDGSEITITALTDNNLPEQSLTDRLLVSLGNIRFYITIIQSSRTDRDYIEILNFTNLQGDLGDEILNYITTTPTFGTMLRDMLKNENNFGLYGTVPFAGFKIGGLYHKTPVVPQLIEKFDVIFLPFTNDYSGDSSTIVFDNSEAINIRSWLRNENKVLVTYTSNQTVLESMGITSSLAAATNTSYRINPAAPEIFLNGPFGQVSTSYTSQMTTPTIVRTISSTAYPQITPLLMNGTDGIAIGVDMETKVVYLNDQYMYLNPSTTYASLSGNGEINNDLDRLIANIWAWIAETVLGDEHDPSVTF